MLASADFAPSSYPLERNPRSGAIGELVLPSTENLGESSDAVVLSPFQNGDSVGSSGEVSRQSRRGLAHRIQRFFESTWSPGAEFLPQRQVVEALGHSPMPFRTSPVSRTSEALRTSLNWVASSEAQTVLSHWSSLYSYDVYHPRVTSELDGVRILHLSDVHLMKGNDLPIRELHRLVEHIYRTGTGVDMVVFTGDLLTYLPDDLSREALFAFKRITEMACHSFFVHGNHDYHGRTPGIISKFVEAAGFDELTNKTVACTVNGAKVNFIGVDDAYFGRPMAPDRVSTEDFNVVLVHNLDGIRANFPSEVDLFLSGHTHWGELRSPMRGSLKYLDGMWWMGKYGYCDDVNQHTKGWDGLSDRSLSFVHPGLARHYVPRRLAFAPGFALHTLRSVPGMPVH